MNRRKKAYRSAGLYAECPLEWPARRAVRDADGRLPRAGSWRIPRPTRGAPAIVRDRKILRRRVGIPKMN